jgi:hypothetical protein
MKRGKHDKVIIVMIEIIGFLDVSFVVSNFVQ